MLSPQNRIVKACLLETALDNYLKKGSVFDFQYFFYILIDWRYNQILFKNPFLFLIFIIGHTA